MKKIHTYNIHKNEYFSILLKKTRFHRQTGPRISSANRCTMQTKLHYKRVYSLETVQDGYPPKGTSLENLTTFEAQRFQRNILQYALEGVSPENPLFLVNHHIDSGPSLQQILIDVKLLQIMQRKKYMYSGTWREYLVYKYPHPQTENTNCWERTMQFGIQNYLIFCIGFLTMKENLLCMLPLWKTYETLVSIHFIVPRVKGVHILDMEIPVCGHFVQTEEEKIALQNLC